MFRLVVMDGVDRDKTAEIEEGTTFLGRSLRNQIVLDDGSVSNRHLKMVRVGGKIFVEDLRSTNGTRVNGRRVEPGQSVAVAVGDLIRVGRTLIRIDALPEKGGDYADKAGWWKAATLEEIRDHGYVLTPGRYVGAEEVEDDGVPFEERMAELSAELYEQFARADELEATIKGNLEALGYGG